MSYKHCIRFKLEQDYYIDAVTYRWAGVDSAKIVAEFYTDKPLSEQRALLFTFAWYILSEDKGREYTLGFLTLKSYSDVEFSVEEVECSCNSTLWMDCEIRDTIPVCEPDVLIEQIVTNWNTSLNADQTVWDPSSDEEIIQEILKRANRFRTGGY